MKREGRQHGTVQTNRVWPEPITRPRRVFLNQVDFAQTAGRFTKVSQKPTNHSKYTGKCWHPRCGQCRDHPVCKAKDKTKGAQKLRTCDVTANHRLVSWRVVDNKVGLGHYPGNSASGLLDSLAKDSCYDDNDDVHNFEDNVVAEKHHGNDVDVDLDHDVVQDEDDDADDKMSSFCDVGLWWDHEDEDEGWYVVGEM